MLVGGTIVVAAEMRSVPTKHLTALAFSATAGVAVEYYDFFLYGYAAASVFPAEFFPSLPPRQALVFSYLAFGAGFPARLVGSFIFGHLGDRIGRKSSFLIGLGLIGGATCSTALLPGYAKLGTTAQVLLVVLRMIQGIGLGGEFGGATSLLAECAGDRRTRAFWISLANLGIPIGAVLASVALLVSGSSFTGTGWRIAMLCSVVIVIPAAFTRAFLAESPSFDRLKQGGGIERVPSLGVWRAHAPAICLIALIGAFQQMDGYVSGTYVISFMQSAGIPLATIARLLLLARVADALGVLLSGPLADRLGRKRVTVAAIAATAVLSYPFARAAVSRQLGVLAALQFLVALGGIGMLHGLVPMLAADSFPTRYRYSGSGIAFNASAILGGAVAPPLLAALIGPDPAGKWVFMPGVYAGYAAIANVALRFLPATRTELDVEKGPPARP